MTRFNEFIVGVVFFFAMGVLVYFTVIKGEFFDTRTYYTMSVIFDEVQGLAEGDHAQVNGVEGGVVTSIRLLEDSRVRVVLKMHVNFRIYENYSIVMKNTTALGGRIISINPGRPEVDGIYFSEIETRTDLSGASLGDPFSLLAEVIQENRDELASTILNISQFAEKINKGDGTIARLVNEDTVHAGADKTLKQVRDTIEDSREQAPVTSFIRAALTFF
ncbi:MAG TPA: MlaD family protein [Spirochaetota bacterium]|nr:MCE family protein [Spirochaetota bacterium]HQO40130.1 MlaD family protein [Spirochaetota bacterium]